MTGIQLKNSLKLSGIEKVYISMVYKSNPQSFIIFFDSARPHKVMTKGFVNSFSKVRLNRGGRNLDYSPLIDIEKFGGNSQGSLFIIYDMAFATIGKPYKENTSKDLAFISSMWSGKIKEYVTLFDLMDKDNASILTKQFRGERNKVMGAENKTAKLIDTIVNQADNSVTFQFLTEATNKYPKGYEYGEVNPKTLNIVNNPSKTYEMSIKILEFFDWLKTHPEGESITGKDIKEILEVSNAQVFSNSPSFQYQGFNYWDSQLDASIYPTGIAPKQWNKIHGDGQAFLDKHLYGLLRQIKFFLNPMASQLTKKLRDRGLI